MLTFANITAFWNWRMPRGIWPSTMSYFSLFPVMKWLAVNNCVLIFASKMWQIQCTQHAHQGRSQPHSPGRARIPLSSFFPEILIIFSCFFSSNFSHFLPHFGRRPWLRHWRALNFDASNARGPQDQMHWTSIKFREENWFVAYFPSTNKYKLINLTGTHVNMWKCHNGQ